MTKETAIPYKIPPNRETVYHADVSIKKQAGRYELTVDPQPGSDSEIVKKVKAALENVESELNG